MNWIDEFIELYISQRTEDLKAAFALKRKYIPPKLYRYRPVKNMEHIKDEICGGNIFLSLPSKMNDPYDSCSLLGEHHPEVYAQTKQEYEKRFRNTMDESTFNHIFYSDNWIERLIEYVAKSYVSSQEVDEMKTKVLQIIMGELEKLNSNLNDMINKTSRFACFTEKATNLPMWNHYANGHEGVCLEYDTTSFLADCNIDRLFPIKYIDKLPDGTLRLAERSIDYGAFMDYFLMHKLDDWSYEKEWRLIYHVGVWYSNPNNVPDEFWGNGISVKFALPSKVYLGTKIHKENEQKIREFCIETGIPVHKMKCTEYGLC